MKKLVHVVGAVIVREDGAILCALRSPTMTLPNVWEFPGGKIEHGEKPEAALIREIKEELGCSIEVGPLVADVYHEYEAFRVYLLTFKAKIISRTPVAKEHAELRWVMPDQLKLLKWAPADVPTLQALS